MFKYVILILFIAALAGGIVYFDSIHSNTENSASNNEQAVNVITTDNSNRPVPASNKSMMKITSPAFAEGEMIPKKYTCDGEGISPPLAISGIPPETKSLALIADDPDAPSGTFTHWVVWDIDPKTAEIAEGDIPAGAVSGTNSGGRIGYYPPCPPSGTHRYIFTVYVLDMNLNLSSDASRNELEAAMKGHIISQGELMVEYSR